MRDVKENIKVVDEMEIIIYKHKQAHVFLEATNYFYLIYENTHTFTQTQCWVYRFTVLSHVPIFLSLQLLSPPVTQKQKPPFSPWG